MFEARDCGEDGTDGVRLELGYIYFFVCVSLFSFLWLCLVLFE
jgi:hypothetical protein